MATGLQPSPTCKRDWSATGVHRWDFIFGCPLAAAAIFPARFRLTDGLLLILLFGLSLTAVGGLVGFSAGAAYSSLACFLVASC